MITYNYPGSKDTPANASAKANTTEVYGALGWKWLTAKGWYGGMTGTDTTKNTRGSNYLELNANYEIVPTWNLIGHVGHQKVKNYIASGDTDASYSDWKIGVTKDVGFGVVGLSYSDTNAKGTCNGGSGGTNAYCWGTYNGTSSSNYRDASQGQVLLSFTKSL